MSKSGLFAHFGSKEELQIAVLEEANRENIRRLVEPVLTVPSGLPRLEAYCDRLLSDLENRTYPGICFITMVRAEFCARPGVLRDQIMSVVKAAHRYMVKLIKEAQSAGELCGKIDPELLAFELEALCDAPNWSLHDVESEIVIKKARTAVQDRLAQARLRGSEAAS